MGTRSVTKNRLLLAALAFLPSCRGCAEVPAPSPSFFLAKQPVKPASSPLAKASEDARPAWAASLDGQPHGFAPQVHELDKAWSRALSSGPVPAPDKGVLLCEVKYSAETDPRSGPIGSDPDLSLLIDVGGGGELRAWGGNNQRSAYFSVPQPELSPGAVLRVHLFDRNWGSQADESLGTLTATWQGTVPLTAANPPRSLTCSFLAPAAVAELAEDAAQTASRRLEAVGAQPLSHPLVPGYEHSATWWNLLLTDADRAIAHVAAFVGWAHPQVRPLVAEREAVSTAKRVAAQRLVAEKRAALSPGLPSRGSSFEALATGVDCQKGPGEVDDRGCGILLDIVALDKQLAISNPNGIAGAHCVVLLDDGSTVDNQNLSWHVRRGNRLGSDHFWEGQAEKGEHLVVSVATKPALRPTGARPALFLLVKKQDVLVVRIP